MQHAPPYSDTTPPALEVWVRQLRGMSDVEKLASVFGLIDLALEIATAGTRSRYPTADAREIFLRVAALHLTRDEMIAAYDWDPKEHEQSGNGV